MFFFHTCIWPLTSDPCERNSLAFKESCVITHMRKQGKKCRCTDGHDMIHAVMTELTLHSMDTYNRQLLKTLREKKKLLRTSNFSFPQCFLLNQINVSPFVHIFDIISLFAAELEEPKIGIYEVKG